MPYFSHFAETTAHIFLQCYITKKFWLHFGLNIDLLDLSLSHWLNALKHVNFPSFSSTPPSLFGWLNFFPFALWNLWINRNTNLHEKKKVPFASLYGHYPSHRIQAPHHYQVPPSLSSFYSHYLDKAPYKYI